MTRWKRLFYYLLINIIVTAAVMSLVLYAWNTFYVPPDEAPLVVTSTPTATSEPIEATAESQATEEAAVVVPEKFTYIVQSGDTLSGIAFEFNTTVEEILALNDLPNPDSLAVGDALILPGVVPVQEDAPVPTETGTPPPRPTSPSLTLPPAGTPRPTPDFIDIEITTVIAAGSLEDERVVIRYNGEGEIILDGWRLEDSTGQSYTFPNLTLFMDGAVNVYTKAGTDTVIELYWGLSQSVWVSGEVVTLIDPTGTIQTAYQIP